MKRRAQAIMDYVLLFAVVIAALVTMSIYVKNSLSGKWREAADTIGQGENFAPR